MAWVIAVLGAVLAAGGGAALWNGSGYIRLDWGQAETVAGTVALSAGVVTIAIAAVLFALRDLARRPARAAASGVGLEAVHLAEEAEAPARGRLAGKLARVGMPKPEPALPEPPAAPVETDPAPLAAAPEPRPRAAPVAVPEAPRPAAPVLLEAPTVVGRYEANGASYVLFSDGTIEVETDSGTHRFASMADLKEHIERQDAG
ncbi:hypothetical protein [Lichenibacterium dinghuense]|uniref:hypothetical protein n=1 Tax=Lichenibacterium dinghuense TaxID=2895977 RepID=UPI001F238059|nr:hypothetical protein [Lichenibacterium sp. 6Y81]